MWKIRKIAFLVKISTEALIKIYDLYVCVMTIVKMNISKELKHYRKK